MTGKPQDHKDLGKDREELKKGGVGENEIPQVEKKWRKQEKPANDTAVAVTDGCFCSIYTSEYTPPFVSSTTSGFFFLLNPCMTIKSFTSLFGGGREGTTKDLCHLSCQCLHEWQALV